MAGGVTVEELFTKWGFKVDLPTINKLDAALNTLVNTADLIGGALRSGLGTLVDMVRDVADVGDEADETAQKFNLTAEALQELRYAAKLSGVANESLSASLRNVLKTSQAFLKGKGGDAFKALGITPAQLRQAKGLDDVIGLLADSFAAMPDGARKSSLALQIFGRDGLSIVPFLNRGRAGIAGLRQEIRDLGGVIDNETAAASGDFNDELDRLLISVRGIGVSIGSAMLPQFSEWVTTTRELLRENRALIQQGLRVVLDLLLSGASAVRDFTAATLSFVGNKENLRTTFDVLKGGLTAVIGLSGAWILLNLPLLLLVLRLNFIRLGQAIRGSRVAMAGLLGGGLLLVDMLNDVDYGSAEAGTNITAFGLQAATVIGIVYQLAMAFKGAGNSAAIAWIKATWPLLALGAVIAGVVLLLEDVYHFFTGGNSAIGEAVEQYRKMGGIFEWIAGLMEGLFKGDWSAFAKSIETSMAPVLDWLSDKFQGVKDAVSGLIDKAMSLTNTLTLGAFADSTPAAETGARQAVASAAAGSSYSMSTGPISVSIAQTNASPEAIGGAVSSQVGSRLDRTARNLARSNQTPFED